MTAPGGDPIRSGTPSVTSGAGSHPAAQAATLESRPTTPAAGEGVSPGAKAPARRAPRRGTRPELPPGPDGSPAWFAGVDEAGRGPVLGPLVVAGVAGQDWALFKRLGCTDSKLLAPERRQAIDRDLRRSAGLRIEVRHIGAETLDAERRQGVSLNEIEARRFRDILQALGAPHVWLDAADVDAARFGRTVTQGLRFPSGGEVRSVVSEHEADLHYPVVGAASIIAKVARDAAVAELARRLERQLGFPLGSGYASDPKTQRFLAEWVRQFRSLPEGTRTTWATAHALMAPKATRLEEFP